MLLIKLFYPGIIVPALVIVPIIIALIKKVYIDKPLKIIFMYLVFSGLMNIIEEVVGTHHINNLPLLHIYTIIEFLLITRYFQKLFSNKKINHFITVATILFVFLSILDFLFLQDIHKYNSYPRPIAAIIIILLCIYHIFREAEKEHKKTWPQQPENWITIGLLIYFCSSLFYFAFLNVITDMLTDNIYFIFIYVHATLVLFMYLLFAKGFLVYKHER